MAVASSGDSKSAGTDSGGLVDDARAMRSIFETYSRKMATLTMAELDQLGQLNADAKGIAFKTQVDWAKEFLAQVQSGTRPESDADFIWDEYKQLYYLPPGVSTEVGPDMFSEWSYSDRPDFKSSNGWGVNNGPFFKCEIDSPWGCQRGSFYDWFGRKVGTYQSDNTVHGVSDLMLIGQGLGKQFRDLWKAAGGDFVKAIADIASNYPGIGTAVAAAATFLEAVGSGASLENAALAAGRSAVPSTMRAAYDVGVGLATRQELDIDAALDIAMAAAINQGIVSGDVLERFNSMKKAYEDAKSAGEQIEGGIGTLGTTASIATA